MADNRSSSSSGSASLAAVSKFELSISDGSKTTVSKLAKDLKPLLVVTLKADTTLCNKQLKAISELDEEGVFANKCTPIAVLVGTLNEIEHWEAKMQLKFPILQGTPEFLELIGCCTRGKVKRSCVLLGSEDNIEFIDTAIKSGVSFVPKLKEYLETVAARPAATKGKGKKAAASGAARAPSKKPRAAPAAAEAVVATPVASGGAVKLKVTRKSVSEKADAPEAKKGLAAAKKAVSKKRIGKSTEAETAAPAKARKAAPASPAADKSAAAVSTSTPNEDIEAIVTTAKSPSNNDGKTKAPAGRSTAGRGGTKSKRRTDPTSDIESPTADVTADGQSRQRKRIKITS